MFVILKAKNNLIFQPSSSPLHSIQAQYDELVPGAMARWRDDLRVCRPRHPAQQSVLHEYMANYPIVRDRGVGTLPNFGKQCVISACLASGCSPQILSCSHSEKFANNYTTVRLVSLQLERSTRSFKNVITGSKKSYGK